MVEPSAGADIESRGPLLLRGEPDAQDAPATAAAPLGWRWTRRWQTLAPVFAGFLLAASVVFLCSGDSSSSGTSLVPNVAKQSNITFASAASKALKCYVDGPDDHLMMMMVPATEFEKGKEPVCFFYKYKCHKNDADKGCTAVERKEGSVKGFHAYGTADLCHYLETVSYDPDSVQCCNTSLCNPGDSKQKEKENEKEKEKENETEKEKENEKKHSVSRGHMRCYQGFSGTTILPFTCGEDVDMCATYKYKCTSGDSSCSEAEVSRAFVKEASVCSKKVMSGVNMCAYFKALSTEPSEVVCCDTSLCNVPQNMSRD